MAIKYQTIANGEINVAEFLPYSSLVSDRVVKTIDGAYLTTWRIDGIAFETTDAEDLNIAHNALNQLIRGLGEVALWSHRIRRQFSDQLQSSYNEPFAAEIAKRYYATFSGYNMMENQIFLTLVYRPELKIKTGLFGRVIDITEKSADSIRNADKHALRKVEELSARLQSTLKKYDLEPLTTYEEKDVTFSHQLSFYSYLLNAIWVKVPVTNHRIRDILPISRLLFVGDKLEIRTPVKTRYVSFLDLKDWPKNTEPGCLNALLYMPFEYIETQSFSVLNKPTAKERLERQRNQLISTEDVSGSEIDELNDALDRLIGGDFVLGEYHHSLAIFGESVDEAMRNRAEAFAVLSNDGFQTVNTDIVSDSLWFAQHPANWRYRPREANITSLNFAGVAAMHNFGTGKRNNNPWGEAVTILKTPNGAPFYFNWHSTHEDDVSLDKKAPANTTIIGMTGSGKTVLELFLILMTLKYSPTIVFFDKDRGAEIALRALGGNYRLLKKGVPTGFNPCQLENTENNINFLIRLFKSLVPRPLIASEERDLERAVRVMMGFTKTNRGIYAVCQQLDKTEDNGVHAYLEKWCRGESYGWVLDNAEDKIDLNNGRLFGFDDTDFLEDPEILTPVTMYLLHLTENLIDGRKFIYVMAEFWKRLQLPAFADFAANKQYTIRKQNGFGVFDTQSPAQILKTPHVAAMVEQSATQIFLPNPKADYNQYVEGFKVTEMEFETIRKLGESSRQFLVKQGHKSTVVTLDLGGLEEMLDIFSTSTENVEMLDEIRLEVGDNPAVWLPIYLERLNQRKLLARHSRAYF